MATRNNNPHDQHEDLRRALAQALAALDVHELRFARGLSEFGNIELPEGQSSSAAAQNLEPIGPFYLAYELERAGLLRTAELVTGLFASGAITLSLGTAAQLLRKFWQDRHERLTDAERAELFGRVFEAPYFDRLFGALARDLVSHADNQQYPSWQEAVSLEQSARQLIDFLATRASGMTAFAARDIVSAINEAIRFLRDRTLQMAFGVNSLWSLVAVAANDNMSATLLQQYVDRGKSGQVILHWLTQAAAQGDFRLDPAAADFRELVGAAQRWLSAAAAVPSTAQTAVAARQLAAA